MIANTLSILVERASFIFAGTVTSLGESSLRVLPSRPGLAVVRFDRGFLINPVLGKLDGRPITVQLARDGKEFATLAKGQRAIFFTTAWVHGEQIAVSELARLPADAKTAEEVTRMVASIPERHLSDRIASSVVIVHGTVTEISRAKEIPRSPSEHDPDWMRALIEVVEVLKGKTEGRGAPNKVGSVALLFPGSRDLAFRDTPRPTRGQEAIFLLHQAAVQVTATAYVAPDSADIQPPGELATVRRLIGGSGSTAPQR
jgi:hypothetical protein